MLIRNCNLDGNLRDLRIEEGKIQSISTAASAVGGETVLDAEGNVAVVGLADAHTHLDKSMLVDRADYIDTAAPDKGRRTREQKAKLTEEESYQNARSVLVEAVKNGTVAIRTNVDVDPVFELRGYRALLRLKEEFRDLIDVQVVPFAQEGVFNYPETPDLLRAALELGGDGVGGHTIIDKDGAGHIDSILSIGKDFGVSCDFHVDESGKPEHFLLPYLAEQTKKNGMEGRVNAIHACSLSTVDDEAAAEAIRLSAEAGLRFLIAPTAISTRSLTRSKQLLEAGLAVNIGSDNVGDFFNPLGNANVLHVASLLAYAHRYFTNEGQQSLLGMISSDARGLFGRALGAEGITEGADADITVLHGTSVREVLSRLGQPRFVVRKGRVVKTTTETDRLFE